MLQSDSYWYVIIQFVQLYPTSCNIAHLNKRCHFKYLLFCLQYKRQTSEIHTWFVNKNQLPVYSCVASNGSIQTVTLSAGTSLGCIFCFISSGILRSQETVSWSAVSTCSSEFIYNTTKVGTLVYHTQQLWYWENYRCVQIFSFSLPLKLKEHELF